MHPSPRPRCTGRSTLLRALLVAPVLAACGGDRGTEAAPPPLARLSINQAGLDTLSELDMRQLTVSGFDAQGLPHPAPGLVWLSSDTGIVSVDATGIVTARQPGSATVTARSGTVATTLALRVLAIPVTDLAIRLVGGVSTDTLLVGTAAGYVAEARDAAGRTLLGRRVAIGIPPSPTATLDSLGRIVGLAVGALEVTARLDDVERRHTIIVRPPFARALAVRLADPKQLRDTLWVGLRDSAIVTFTDSTGQPLAPTPFRPTSFTVADPGLALVDFEGRVTPLAPGTTTLRAAGDRLVAAKVLEIVRAPIMTVAAAPDTVRVLPGEAAQLRPILLDGAGLRVTTLGSRALRFESASPAVATVDAQGQVRGVATGLTSLRVTSERGTTTVPVRVLSPAGDAAFRITVRFVGPTPAPEVVAAFDAARARWEGVIRETIGSSEIELTQNRCGSGDPSHTETIRDVLIFARIDTIDGPSKILGQAGPCILKRTASGRFLPMVGRMAFDSADMRTMITSGRLPNVIAHEMGHVLGIGTLWDAGFQPGAALAVQRGTFDPRYTGVGGMLASAGMGFTAWSLGETGAPQLERVPLENTGGSGTVGAHWRRSVFGNELMNGFAGAGASPLSLLTVQAMLDLGYSVGTSGAEPWGQLLVVPTGASRIFPDAEGATAIREQLLAPEWQLDAAGRVRPWSPVPGRGPARPK